MAAHDDLRGKRSRVPFVFGVISLVLSLPFILLLLVSSMGNESAAGYGRAMVREIQGPLGKSYRLQVDGRELQADAKKAAAALFIGKLLMTLFGVLSLLLFVAGIGQLKYRAWGRTLTLTWAFLALCFDLLLVMMLLPELALRVREVADHALGGDFHAAEAMTRLPGLSIMLLTATLALYPLFSLFFFVLPHTKASMR